MRARVRAGDREAFAQLYDDCSHAVYNYALRLTGDWSAAEEIMSETFLTAWHTRARIEARDGSLLPWLLGIATHKADNARRRVRRWRVFQARQPPPRVQEDFAQSTVDRIEDARRLEAVRRALGRLRRQEREVLVLCVWSGLDYRQAAEALGVPVGTVRSRLSRARGRLARLTEEDLEPGGGRGEVTSAAASAAPTERKERT
ncbi:RNA polymerase sigma factor [Streptomyces sp. NPDC006296]|uniref:RNA polymerase sigma factor n=1 Tax=Streptomyces sp. NPDC006296 TaxID=3156746 RepID=UPI0033AFDB72